MLYKTSYKPIIVTSTRNILSCCTPVLISQISAMQFWAMDRTAGHDMLCYSFLMQSYMSVSISFHRAVHNWHAAVHYINRSTRLNIASIVWWGGFEIRSWSSKSLYKFCKKVVNRVFFKVRNSNMVFSTDGRSTPYVDKLLLSLHFVPFL